MPKEFDIEELKHYHGREGRPAYVAYRGKIYDVSESKRWKAGLHMNRHRAGQDLTADIQAAPHNPDILERVPRVGTLKKAGPPQRKLPYELDWIFARAPFLRRHPHPMAIHFPIVFLFAVLMFDIFYLLLKKRSFEITALHCLGAAVFFTPVALITGFYTWWLNYEARPIRPVRIKQRLSFMLLALEIIAFTWRLKIPGLLNALTWQGIIYLVIILIMFILVFIIGWFGASLTFPIEKPPDSNS